MLDHQRLSTRISDRPIDHVELRRSALGCIVAERKIPVEAVPRAVEPDGETFDYIERSVGIDGEKIVELSDANRAALRAGRITERAEKNTR
jgi:hypothetical protein